MTHRRAQRLLSALPDGLLAPATEAAVRRHLTRCASCRESLAAMEAADDWLRRLPAALVPLDPSPAAEQRLARLARWSQGPDTPAPRPMTSDRSARSESIAGRPRWGIPAVGAVVAAACLAVVLVSVVRPPVDARPAEQDEAFNFVLASDFSSDSSNGTARAQRHVAVTGVIRPASARGQESDSYYLPIGVR